MSFRMEMTILWGIWLIGIIFIKLIFEPHILYIKMIMKKLKTPKNR